MKVNLHIERLVLDGLPVEQRQGPHLQATIERELIRLLADGNSLAGVSTGGAVASIDAGSIDTKAGTGAASLGKQIAAAVHGGLGGRR